MSYDIYIGERETITIKDEDGKYVYEGVREIKDTEAPEFDNDDLTGKSNGRHPGYGQFYEFCQMVDLVPMFFDKKHGLLREHPGCQDLTLEHVEALRLSIDQWMTEHQNNGPPGFLDGQDMILARLLWYEWWMTHALLNCKRPAIYNH